MTTRGIHAMRFVKFLGLKRFEVHAPGVQRFVSRRSGGIGTCTWEYAADNLGYSRCYKVVVVVHKATSDATLPRTDRRCHPEQCLGAALAEEWCGPHVERPCLALRTRAVRSRRHDRSNEHL